MEKKEKKQQTTIANPRVRSYPKEMQIECINLLKSGMNIDEVSAKFNGHPGIRAIRRYCKRFDYNLQK